MKIDSTLKQSVMSAILSITQTLPSEQARRFLMLAREDTQDGYWLSLRADLYQALAKQLGESHALEQLRPLDDALRQIKVQPVIANEPRRRWWPLQIVLWDAIHLCRRNYTKPSSGDLDDVA